MKKLFSNYIRIQVFGAAAIVLLIANSCNKQNQPLVEEARVSNAAKFDGPIDITAVSRFNKSVGKPIDGRLGDRWISNYEKKYGYKQSYMLNLDTLKAIVKQPNCVGICLYYAKDVNNKTHILPIGINVKNTRIKTLTVNYSKGNMSWGNISWATAQQWIAKDAGTVDAHFFGSYTFDRLSQTPCSTIRVDFAIDDKNIPQLLLTNTCQVNFSKMYEDDSNRCPSDCPN